MSYPTSIRFIQKSIPFVSRSWSRTNSIILPHRFAFSPSSSSSSLPLSRFPLSTFSNPSFSQREGALPLPKTTSPLSPLSLSSSPQLSRPFSQSVEVERNLRNEKVGDNPDRSQNLKNFSEAMMDKDWKRATQFFVLLSHEKTPTKRQFGSIIPLLCVNGRLGIMWEIIFQAIEVGYLGNLSSLHNLFKSRSVNDLFKTLEKALKRREQFAPNSDFKLLKTIAYSKILEAKIRAGNWKDTIATYRKIKQEGLLSDIIWGKREKSFSFQDRLLRHHGGIDNPYRLTNPSVSEMIKKDLMAKGLEGKELDEKLKKEFRSQFVTEKFSGGVLRNISVSRWSKLLSCVPIDASHLDEVMEVITDLENETGLPLNRGKFLSEKGEKKETTLHGSDVPLPSLPLFLRAYEVLMKLFHCSGKDEIATGLIFECTKRYKLLSHDAAHIILASPDTTNILKKVEVLVDTQALLLPRESSRVASRALQYLTDKPTIEKTEQLEGTETRKGVVLIADDEQLRNLVKEEEFSEEEEEEEEEEGERGEETVLLGRGEERQKEVVEEEEEEVLDLLRHLMEIKSPPKLSVYNRYIRYFFTKNDYQKMLEACKQKVSARHHIIHSRSSNDSSGKIFHEKNKTATAFVQSLVFGLSSYRLPHDSHNSLPSLTDRFDKEAVERVGLFVGQFSSSIGFLRNNLCHNLWQGFKETGELDDELRVVLRACVDANARLSLDDELLLLKLELDAEDLDGAAESVSRLSRCDPSLLEKKEDDCFGRFLSLSEEKDPLILQRLLEDRSKGLPDPICQLILRNKIESGDMKGASEAFREMKRGPNDEKLFLDLMVFLTAASDTQGVMELYQWWGEQGNRVTPEIAQILMSSFSLSQNGERAMRLLESMSWKGIVPPFPVPFCTDLLSTISPEEMPRALKLLDQIVPVSEVLPSLKKNLPI